MKVGDKVRLVHGKESGRITRIIDAYQIEVEIEDGFRIPVAKKEVALISSEERRLTNEIEAPIAAPVIESQSLSGQINIAFKPFNDSIYQVYLINERNIPFHFVSYHYKNGFYTQQFSGTLAPEQAVCIEERKIQDFSQWPTLHIQVMYVAEKVTQLIAPQTFEVHAKADKFYQNKKNHSILGKDVHFWAIDTKVAKNAFYLPDALASSMTDKADASTQQITEPDYETDLHIEKLDELWNLLSPNQMLQKQIQHFENTLDNAIAVGMEEIIFIHGAGNNTLKNELQKRLSKDKRIEYFKDAKKERFGYGATLVKLK
ncbi:MAG: DUF2027 domain-containing protein [Cytophagaceae bacterium]